MKETVLGLGVILLFAGIIVLPWSIQRTTTPQFPIIASREDLVYPDWTLAAQLNASDHMVIYFSRPEYENIPEPTGERYMFVDIIDPHGGNTTFNITFTKTSFFRGVLHNDGGLVVEHPEYTQAADIGGTAQYTGLYTVKVYPIVEALVLFYYPNDGTMANLNISTTVVITEYPYIVGLPVSVALAVAGLILTVWGARSPKRRVKSRKG